MNYLIHQKAYLLFASILLIVMTFPVWAEPAPEPDSQPVTPSVPQLINYQGMLTDAQGDPVATGEYGISVSIFAQVSGGEPVWGPQLFPEVPVVRGHFNIILGPKDDAADRDIASAFVGPEAYLEITLGEEAPIAPRQRILSTPYAINAMNGVPVGSIIAWHKNMDGTPSLPDGWVECNGQTLDYAGSPYTGQVIPNLNGELISISKVATKGRFLRGHSESGITEQDQSNNLVAFAVGGNTEPPEGYWANLPDDGSWTPHVFYCAGRSNDFIRMHLHGRETRPQAFTVVWIMRVL